MSQDPSFDSIPSAVYATDQPRKKRRHVEDPRQKWLTLFKLTLWYQLVAVTLFSLINTATNMIPDATRLSSIHMIVLLGISAFLEILLFIGTRLHPCIEVDTSTPSLSQQVQTRWRLQLLIHFAAMIVYFPRASDAIAHARADSFGPVLLSGINLYYHFAMDAYFSD